MRPRALIVEDDPNTQRLLAAILAAEGMDVALADDGDIAIDLLSRRGHSRSFFSTSCCRASVERQ